MRCKFGLFALLFVIVFKARSQSTVALIDEVVAKLKSDLISFRKVDKLNSETGYRSLYYFNNEPVAIEVVEKGRIEKRVSWFFYKTRLIYTETIWTDTLFARKVHEEKTYHYEEAMIAWLDSENTFVEASSAEFVDLDKSLRVYGRKIYREALEE